MSLRPRASAAATTASMRWSPVGERLIVELGGERCWNQIVFAVGGVVMSLKAQMRRILSPEAAMCSSAVCMAAWERFSVHG